MTVPVPAHPRLEVDVPRRKKSDETDVTSDATATADAGKRRRGGVSDADREVKRKNQLTPRWWIWTMIGLMVLGLAWIVVFYLSSSLLPVPGWDNWNLVAGFALVLAGFAMTTRWR
ncbi:cell division protein CrgA [Kineococcus sp. TBRC 1896]|uniref:Cell division protein CrgA n=1 Tax=Kineococcus mangrovi TaxID=1660183 RepID=A0ABV4I3U4_9ACTN